MKQTVLIFLSLFLLGQVLYAQQGSVSMQNTSHPGAIFEVCPGDVVVFSYTDLVYWPDYFYVEHTNGTNSAVIIREGDLYQGNWSATDSEAEEDIDDMTGDFGGPNAQTRRNGGDIDALFVSGATQSAASPKNGTIPFTIPNDMESCRIIFYEHDENSVGGNDYAIAIDTFFITVVQPELDIVGLANAICSRDTIAIQLSPQPSTGASTGTSLTVRDGGGGPVSGAYLQSPSAQPAYVGASYDFIPDGLNTVTTPLTQNLANRDVRLRYVYTPYMVTTAASCNAITYEATTTIYNNSIDSVSLAPLTNNSDTVSIAVNASDPTYFASLINSNPPIPISYSGVYVLNDRFLGATADSGRYEIGVLYNNNGCTALLSDTAEILDVPPRVLPETHCRLDTALIFGRDTVTFPWDPNWDGLSASASNTRTTQTRAYKMTVSANPSSALSTVNGTPGQEVYALSPAPGVDSVRVVIAYYRESRTQVYNTSTGTVSSSTPTEHLVVRYEEVVYVVDPPEVVIDSTIAENYCNYETFVNLGGSTPSNGSHYITARNGNAANSSTTLGSVFNPNAVYTATNETTDVNYYLIYEAGQGNCTARDTANVRILADVALAIAGRNSSGLRNTNNRYCTNGGVDLLSGLPSPTSYISLDSLIASHGNFSGPGIVGDGPLFNPALAGTGSKTITYTYISQYGCISSLDSTFTVNLAPVAGLETDQTDTTYCADDTLGILTGTPSGGAYSGPTISGPTDVQFNPSIVYSPNLPNTPGYVNYAYVYEDPTTLCRDTVEIEVKINPLPSSNLSMASYHFCQAAEPQELFGLPTGGRYFFGDTAVANGIMHGALVNGQYVPNPNYSDSTRYPVMVQDTLIYETEALSCTARDTQIVQIHPHPEYSFYATHDTTGLVSDSTVDACFGRDTLFFYPHLLSGVVLNYSGPGVLFEKEFMISDIAGIGTHRIQAVFQDTSNAFVSCLDTAWASFHVHSLPNVKLSADNSCSTDSVLFVINNDSMNLTGTIPGTTTLYDSITTAVWNMGDGNSFAATYDNNNQFSSFNYPYNGTGIFEASLYVENNNYCSDSDTIRVLVLPNEQPNALAPYSEDFDSGANGWVEEAEGQAQSSNLWEWGTPADLDIAQDHGQVWITRIDSTYGADESGWVYSPCIDLTALDRPMLKLDFFNETDAGNDGTVIEYFDPQTEKWLPLGNVNRGINWYNQAVVAGRPGVQDLAPRGWSGINTDWEDARYSLDAFRNYDNFRFRVAFGAIGASQTPLRGFAFDNVWIGNRERNVLLEHFSNAGVVNMNPINQYVYNLVYRTPAVRDVILLQINNEDPAFDPMNSLNRDDPSARASIYGIDGVSAKAVVDGRRYGQNPPNSADLRTVDFEMDMLEDARFDIRLEPIAFIGNNNLQINATLIAKDTLAAADYDLQLVVTEDSAVYFANGVNFQTHSLLRKMLPDAAGTRFNRSWLPGDSVQVSEVWTYNPNNIDTAHLEAVAFVQEDAANSRTIYQAVMTRDITEYINALSTEELVEAQAQAHQINMALLSPNPAVNYTQLLFAEPLSQDFQWKLIDLQGRVLSQGELSAGSQTVRFDLHDLPAAAYFLQIGNANFKTTKKFTVIRP
ncbi:T9SS type A sorting domain-containing protein [Saprospira sp. CCB-QB6]|uniref:T9SS type A sorting domain-containing protein n=1 Tax=Saprospira sp. CCB-QB6 TaxID=3023936 RepID=UPI00234BFD42|nr:T9SS type A sorting domain-containing protein [Saprospira sp. CCB-QB6]WCL80972.1 T9SS type A sorting domain-containing protein [Saprospira sp. CCB-QB6]